MTNLNFNPINIEKNREEIIQFRKDSFEVSFGDTSNFDVDVYINWLKDKSSSFPKGFVLVEENEKSIGQLELSIREYEGQTIGYVHLYYLIPKQRGNGKGKELHNYAKQFFKTHNVSDYHLRVSPTNTQAIRFYKNNGMIKLKPEMGDKVIRMKGTV